jgi:hypothetical protein
MRLPITITYNAGDEVTVVAQPPEWAKWEKQTGHSTTKFSEVAGVWDLLFLGYNTIKREAGGQPVKPFDAWMDTVADITVGESESPKAMNREVSSDS